MLAEGQYAPVGVFNAARGCEGVKVGPLEGAEREESGRYVLGHSDGELERLVAQARLIDPITKRFFADAGITAGMRVLDVGSGAGDVAFLAAGLVGETGEVVGNDRAAAAVDRDAQGRGTETSKRVVSRR